MDNTQETDLFSLGDDVRLDKLLAYQPDGTAQDENMKDAAQYWENQLTSRIQKLETAKRTLVRGQYSEVQGIRSRTTHVANTFLAQTRRGSSAQGMNGYMPNNTDIAGEAQGYIAEGQAEIDEGMDLYNQRLAELEGKIEDAKATLNQVKEMKNKLV